MHVVNAENLLWSQFAAATLNRKLTTDITYALVKSRGLYLSIVVGLYCRCIVGESLDTSMTGELITDALSTAYGG